jgi:hypothetical protein
VRNPVGTKVGAEPTPPIARVPRAAEAEQHRGLVDGSGTTLRSTVRLLDSPDCVVLRYAGECPE